MLEEKDIVLDYQNKTIRSAPGSESEIEIRAIEAVDQAEIIYAILHQDVTYLKIQNRSYIQAKLTAMA